MTHGRDRDVTLTRRLSRRRPSEPAPCEPHFSCPRCVNRSPDEWRVASGRHARCRASCTTAVGGAGL